LFPYCRVESNEQGGLDCRFLASRLKPTTFKIVSLTTIATPHRGSPFADYVINEIIGRESRPFLSLCLFFPLLLLFPFALPPLSPQLTPSSRFYLLSPFAHPSPISSSLSGTHFPAFLNLLDVLRLPNQGDGAAFDALSTVSMKKFNEDTPDDPDVDYYSWGAQFEPSYFNTFKWPHSVIFPIEGPNDGLVSVKSAEWGKSLGVLDGVNHL